MKDEHELLVGFAGDKKTIKVAVEAGEPVPWDLNTKYEVIGTRQPRIDGLVKATGTARYTFDVALPGMLQGAVLRSPHAKARLEAIDLTAAERMPGVRAAWAATVGSYVLHHGDEVAAVAADSLDIARDALAAIVVKYAVEKHAVTVEDAMKAGAPDVLPNKSGNVGGGANERRKAEVEEALAGCDVTWEGTFRTQVQVHTPLESHGTVCRWEGAEKLTVWASTQSTFSVRRDMAKRFNLAPTDVRVITRHMGGAFGSKLWAHAHCMICAELARKAKRPVKLMSDRKAEHTAHGNRPDSRQQMRIGMAKDGEIQAVSAVSWGTAGTSARGAGCFNTGIYELGEIYREHHDVLTNCGPAAPFRAPGRPQGIFALEGTLDMAAHKLGMDPLAFRALNDPSKLRAAERKLGAERIGWSRRNCGKRPQSGVSRGIGYAATTWPDTGSKPAEVTVEVTADGRVLVINGAQDIGTGTRTIMTMVAAEELGIPLALVSARLGDTNDGVGPASGGSKTAPSLMPAVRTAAYAAKMELLGVASGVLEVLVGDLAVTDGRIHKVAEPAKGVAWKDICARIPGGKLTGVGKRRDNFDKYQGVICGCQFAEVEVDVETGLVKVVKVVAVQDCGIALNKLTAEHQVIGGVIQGVAYALHEERIMDRASGRMLNTDFVNYKIAGSLDMPEIEPILFDVAAGSNNIGNLGIGEPPTIPTAAAIANAVFDATGTRCFEIPMTPMRVLAALAREEG